MRIAETILDDGDAELLVDLEALAVADLLAAGLVMDFFDTAIEICLTFGSRNSCGYMFG